MTPKDDFDNFDDVTDQPISDDDGDIQPDMDGAGGKTGSAKGKLVLAGGAAVILAVVGFGAMQMMGGSDQPQPAARPAAPASADANAPQMPPTPTMPASDVAIGGAPVAGTSPLSDTATAGEAPITAPSAPAGNVAAAPGAAGGFELAMPPAIVSPTGGSVPDISLGGENAAVQDEKKNIVVPMNPALAPEPATPSADAAPTPALPLDLGAPAPIAAPADIAAAPDLSAPSPMSPSPVSPSPIAPAPIASADAGTPALAPAPIAPVAPMDAAEPPLAGNQPSAPAGMVPVDAAPAIPASAASPDLEKRLAGLENMLAEIKGSIATKKDLAALESRISRLESGKGETSSASAPRDTYNDDAAPAPVVKKAKPKKAAAKKPAPAKASSTAYIAPQVSSQWVLKGASPGSAWLSQKGSNELRNVKVGETVPGIGKITAIAKASDGRWVVTGTGGRVNQ